MRTKQHNKKRNTAFLFEVLVREYTKAAMNKDESYRKDLLKIIQESFNKKTLLGQELYLYRLLSKETGVSRRIAEKFLAEAKRVRGLLNPGMLYAEQSKLLADIHDLETKKNSRIMDNFVPNYKNLATIAQIFGRAPVMTVKSRIVLEEAVIKTMTQSERVLEESILEPVDSLTYKTFSKKFEDTYAPKLLSEQKQLLNKLIFSFTDNGVGFKAYLNEELGRLKNALTAAFNEEKDSAMLENANKVTKLVESFAKKPIDEEMLTTVMQIQELVKELA